MLTLTMCFSGAAASLPCLATTALAFSTDAAVRAVTIELVTLGPFGMYSAACSGLAVSYTHNVDGRRRRPTPHCVCLNGAAEAT